MRVAVRMPYGGGVVPALVATMFVLSGCQSGSKPETAERIRSDPKERFTENEYGVKASPRVTDLKKVPKGGGREQVGRPYKVRGKWYYPKEQPGYVKVGNASWYGASFHGRLTANGEVYDMFGLSAAHPTFPLPSYARVTNVDSGANIVVRVNDRGPYVADRMMDLSSEAAHMLGYKATGVGKIKVEYIGKAPLEGDDTPMLMASFRPGNAKPSINDGLPTGVMLAMNEVKPQTGYASALATTTGRDLPGVRARQSTTESSAPTTSIDDIIRGAASSEPGRAVRMPSPRPDNALALVASYAPKDRAEKTGSASALEALARPLGDKPQRIEIGAVSDRLRLGEIRAVVETAGGHLVADSTGGTTSYSAELSSSSDADMLLRQLWSAGAEDAFVLRD